MDIEEIIIVSIGCFSLFIAGPLIWAISSYQEKKLKLQRDIAEAGGEEMRAEMASLRERVAVLERLAASEDLRLAGEIERLRHREGAEVRR